MRGLVRAATILVAAGAILYSNSVGQAQQMEGFITLRVPLQLKKMIASTARVYCGLYDGSTTVTDYVEDFDISSGELDQVIEMKFAPPFKIPVIPKTYHCLLMLNAPGQTWQAPFQGPPGPQLWRRAKPEEFFRAEISGPLKK